MNVKEWAERLNGREYGWDLTADEAKQAKLDGVVISYGDSDDLLEFRGAIDDEVGAWKGTKVKLTNEPRILNEELNTKELHFNQMQIAGMRTMTDVWCPKGEDGKVWASWNVTTDIPHETFDIMEEGEIFGRGIVFDVKHLTSEVL